MFGPKSLPIRREFLVSAGLISGIIVACGVCSAQSKPRSTSSVHLQGEVKRGEKFEAYIGKGLVFRLAPDDNGWNIEVGRGGEADEDFTDCVNVPLHGITDRQIEGWHFRSDDNTAGRKPEDFLTPGIGGNREFAFVLTAENESKACANTDEVAHDWSGSRKHQDAMSNFGSLAGGEGRMTITDMKLGNLKAGQQAWIESMKFEVDVSFGKPSR